MIDFLTGTAPLYFEFLPRDRKVKLCERLVEKIANVKIHHEEMKYCKEKKTGRRSGECSYSTRRGAAEL
jgi:hypothetical protein